MLNIMQKIQLIITLPLSQYLSLITQIIYPSDFKELEVGVGRSSHRSIWSICEDDESPATTIPELERW